MESELERAAGRCKAISSELQLVQPPRDVASPYRRATVLIPEVVEDFLESARLVWEGAPEPYDAEIEYGSRGPELAYMSLLNPLVRRRVRRPDECALDAFQATFVREFQAALATVMASMASRPDRLIDYVSQGLVEQGIAGVLAALAGGSDVSLIFHQNLLWAIKRLLLSTYEGAHATIAVLVVPGPAARPLRWTDVTQDGIPFLRKMKSARALSDGQDSVFAFSAEGEFFGLFEKQRCTELLRDVPGLVEWQLRHALTLALKVDGQRRLELFSGFWRYVDDDAAKRTLEASDRSFSSCNQLLWPLALRLSESRQGGLLLVVDNPGDLVAAKCCKAEEVHLEGEPSRIAALRRKYELEGEGAVFGLSLKPNEILREQFLGKAIKEIGIEILSRLAAIDGAIVVRTDGTFCGFGIILSVEGDPGVAPTEGARTRAALLASKFGVAIKISEDGPIAIYKDKAAIFS